MKNKNVVSWLIGISGSVFTSLFGGWTQAMTTLLIFMLIDYVTGLIVAAIFKKSPKTASGALSSKVGFIGLIKKSAILLILIVAYRLDLLINTHYIKDATCIAFIINESVSIIENIGTFMPIPKPILKAIDSLKSKEESDENQDD